MDDIWNRKTVGAIKLHASPKSIGHNPDGDLRGPADYQKLYNTYAGAFPDWHIERDWFVSEGSMVACHYTFSTTHKGILAGVAASSKEVSVHGVGIFRLEGLQLVEERVIGGTLSLMQQIGAA